MGADEIKMICEWLARIEKKLDDFTSRLITAENDIRNLYDGQSKSNLARLKCKEEENSKIDALVSLTAPAEEVKGIMKWLKKRWVIALIVFIILFLCTIGIISFLKSLPADKIAEIIKLLISR